MPIVDELAYNFNYFFKIASQYEVKSGDTFYSISQSLGLSVDELQKVNPDLNVNNLQVGQKINLPPTDHTKMTLADFEKIIVDVASKNNIPSNIFRGLVAAESSGNPMAAANKKSPEKGALGLTQLTPYVRQILGVNNPYDIKQSLEGGARWLSNAYQEAKRLKNVGQVSDQVHWQHALMIYHAGMGAVQKWINAGSPPTGFENVGPKTIKYPTTVFQRGNDPGAFSSFWRK